MPQYEQLLQAWRDSQERADTHRDRCRDAATSFINDLCAYLEMPTHGNDPLGIQLVTEDGQRAVPPEAVQIDDDGIASFRFQIRLDSQPMTQTAFVQQQGEDLFLGVDHTDIVGAVDLADPSSFRPISELLVAELIRTFEFDITVGKQGFPTRVELYRSIEDGSVFPCRLWQEEFYTIQSRFPSDSKTNEPLHGPSDELILVGSDDMRCDWNPDSFTANSPEERFA